MKQVNLSSLRRREARKRGRRSFVFRICRSLWRVPFRMVIFLQDFFPLDTLHLYQQTEKLTVKRAVRISRVRCFPYLLYLRVFLGYRQIFSFSILRRRRISCILFVLFFPFLLWRTELQRDQAMETDLWYDLIPSLGRSDYLPTLIREISPRGMRTRVGRTFLLVFLFLVFCSSAFSFRRKRILGVSLMFRWHPRRALLFFVSREIIAWISFRPTLIRR
jgi:hypothetical protein